MLVAKDGNAIIGTLMLTFREKGFSSYASTDNVAVINSYKGKGIAGLLFQEALKISKENNLDFINSFTATEAGSSIRYHLKMGFVIYEKSFGKIRNSYSFIYPICKYSFLKCAPIRKMVYILNTTKNWVMYKLHKI